MMNGMVVLPEVSLPHHIINVELYKIYINVVLSKKFVGKHGSELALSLFHCPLITA